MGNKPTSKPRAKQRRGAGLAKMVGAAMAAAGLVFGLPGLLYWLGGAVDAPALNTELWETISVGQVPTGAVELICLLVAWACWAYLTVMFAVELIRAAKASNSESGAPTERASGPRRLMQKLAESMVGLQMFTATISIPTGAALAAPTPPTELVVVPESDDETIVDHENDADGFGYDFATEATAQLFGSNPPGADQEFETNPHQTVAVDAIPSFTPQAVTDPGEANESRGGEIPEFHVVEVVKGDTLWGLAEQYIPDTDGSGMNWPAIWEATELGEVTPTIDPANPDLIFPDNRYRIPTSLMSQELKNQLFGQPEPEAEKPVEAPTPTAKPEPAQVPSAVIQPEPGLPEEKASTPSQTQPGQPSLAYGAAGAAAITVIAGIGKWKRRKRLAQASAGSTIPKRSRRERRTRNALNVQAEPAMWSLETLKRGWGSVHPANPGASQVWAVRFNQNEDQAECTWLQDPDRPEGERPEPGPTSPWQLERRRDSQADREVEVWVLKRDDVPATGPLSNPMPLMVGAGVDIFLNLEAVGAIDIIGDSQLQRDPEGVVRSFLTQLVDAPAEVMLLNTELNMPGVKNYFSDASALERKIVAEVHRNRETYTRNRSLLEARTAGSTTGKTTIVVGKGDELEKCSQLLSLAKAPHIPLVIVSLGELPQAFATLSFKPNNGDTLRVAHSNAIVRLGELTWLSADEADDGLAMIAEADEPWETNSNQSDESSESVTDHEQSEPESFWNEDRWADDPATETPTAPDPPVTYAPGSPSKQWSNTEAEPQNWGSADTTTATLDEIETVLESSNESATAHSTSPLEVDVPDLSLVPAFEDEPLIVAEPEEVAVDLNPLPDQWWEIDSGDIPEFEWAEGIEDAAVADAFARAADVISNDAVAQQARANGTQITTSDADEDPRGVSGAQTQLNVLSVDATPPATGAFGTAGLRLELCGPIRLLRLQNESETEVPATMAAGGLSRQQLSMLTYLAYCTSFGITSTPAAVDNAFWPEAVTPEGLPKPTQPRRVSNCISAVRRSLRTIIDQQEIEFITSPTGTNTGHTVDVATVSVDLIELLDALEVGRTSSTGSEEWVAACDTVASILRGPELFAASGAARDEYYWIEEQGPQTQHLVSSIGKLLVDYGNWLNTQERHGDALRSLLAATKAYPIRSRHVSNALVDTYLHLGDQVGAEAEVEIYERDFPEPDANGPRTRVENHIIGGADSSSA